MVVPVTGRMVVLCGGPGGEREVSLDSGRNVHEALIRAGAANDLVVVPESGAEAFLENLDCRLAVMMLHGEFGEDGGAQRILERRGIAFTGSDSRASALAMDKNASKKLFRAHGIPTPRWAEGRTPREIVARAGELGLVYPLFVKPNARGSSVGVSRVDHPADLAAAAEKALSIDTSALAEEMVIGREVTVGWLDGKALPFIELFADGQFYDYRAKYKSDATRYVCSPALAPGIAEAIARFAVEATSLIGTRDLARVDMMLGEKGPMVLEVNTLPGFTAHSLVPMAARAAGIPLEDLCLRLVAMAAGRVGKECRAAKMNASVMAGTGMN